MISLRVVEKYAMPVVSLLIAILLWFYVVGQKELEWTFSVPVSAVVESDEVTAWTEPRHVSVLVKGPRRKLEEIGAQKMNVRLVLVETEPGESMRNILPSMVRDLPPGTEILRIEPAEVRVMIREILQVPYKVAPKIRVAGDTVEISDVTVEPKIVMLYGTREQLEQIGENQIATEMIEARSDVGTWAAMAGVSVPSGIRVQPQTVKITYTIGGK